MRPGKRPRAPFSRSLAHRHGEPWLAFGTPGGDQQDQWTLEFFPKVVDFGMDLQEALDAPTVHTAHFPGSFYPHAAYPGRAHAEARIAPDVLAELERRGHEVRPDAPWDHGQVTAVAWDPASGVLSGAAAPAARTA